MRPLDGLQKSSVNAARADTRRSPAACAPQPMKSRHWPPLWTRRQHLRRRPMADITLWKPEPDVLIHQALGKAGEEAGELAAILFRCTIQGLDSSDPVTGKWNRKALFDEIA